MSNVLNTYDGSMLIHQKYGEQGSEDRGKALSVG